ncbi:MAG: class II fructose-bisphosphate aldolase [Candidatus Kerfeldbacteria bacterium]|nr:class II fructose-bisphosphate aldolase [Candidatus Kerfeldbacteria bacterium]
MLVSVRQLLQHAAKHQYAIGAFNTVNLEMTLGIIRAAVEVQAPVIITVTETTIEYAGLKPITHIVETIAKNSAVNVPVALHLDHAKSFRSIAECIHAGFSSIMIDASDLPFDENVILTRQAVDYAHKRNALAQGEIGNVKTAEEFAAAADRQRYLTDPREAVAFVKATGIDTLAVAVGNVYGRGKMRQGAPPLDLDRLAAIHESIPDIPLVLHGASALKHEQLEAAIGRGIKIINIVTELELAFTDQLRQTARELPDEYDPRDLLEPSIDAVEALTADKLRLFGSEGRGRAFPKHL